MYMLGGYHLERPDFSQIHLAQALPWFLEVSIRGGTMAVMPLVKQTYAKALPIKPSALISYWLKMDNAYDKWSGLSSIDKIGTNDMKKVMNRICAICAKEDT